MAASVALLLLSPPARADTLAALQDKGELVWGADAQGGAPFVMVDPDAPERFIGFEVELADALARALGVGARLQQGAWANLLDMLSRGDIDVALNGIEVADDKVGVCLLSRPYFAAPERLTIRRGDTQAPRSLADVRGRAVGTLPGSAAERILRDAGADVRTYDGGQDDIYNDLALGRTDAVLLDETISTYYGKIDARLEVLSGTFGEVHYAIAVRNAEPELVLALNTAIQQLARDGTLRAIYERWGIWNAATAALLGDDDAAARGPAPAWERWRQASGKRPSFFWRVWHVYPTYLPAFAHGAGLTLLVSVLAMALAIALGLVLAAARAYGPRPLAWRSLGYVEVVRGTPLLVQLVLLYFGLPELGITLSPLAAGVLALGLNYAATESENYRAGLMAVPVTQLEAARVLGLSRAQGLRLVVFPQALRVALPPMTNDFIALLKDSSLISVVTLAELTKTYSMLANATHDHLGLAVLVGAWYLLIGLPFVLLARRLERRLGQRLRRAS
jgi:polar amino acid transport system substrate-binding protein